MTDQPTTPKGGDVQPKVVDMNSLRAMRERVAERRAEEEDKFGSGGGGSCGIDSRFIHDCLRAEEMGDGLLYCEALRGKFVFDKSSARWLEWTGHHWQLDKLDRALASVEVVVDHYLEEANRLSSQASEASKEGKQDQVDRCEKLRKWIFKRVASLRTSGRRKACAEWAHTNNYQPLAIKGDELDQDPWLLGCANGVIDLRTGELRDGRPDDWILKASPVEWQGIDAPCPKWKAALLEIFDGDVEMVAFIQRLLGYSITGLHLEHIFPVWYGERGRNGKGVIVNILKSTLGPMAAPIKPEMLLTIGRPQSSAGPNPEILKLRGLRIAFASEVDQNQTFSTATIKRLTGGEWLTARGIQAKDEIDFKQTHTLIMLTNYQPHAPSDDAAFWQRTILVPFNISFVDLDPKNPNPPAHHRQRNKHLETELLEELPGVLAWLVSGCLLWQKHGLKPPAAVLKATEEYNREEDWLEDFIDECCDRGEGLEEGAAKLHQALKDWWEEVVGKRRQPPSKKKLGQALRKKGFEKEKRGTYVYFGIRLKDSDALFS
ncbi:MAG: DNA primase family protein [Desulfobacterales bacterium]